MRNRLIDHSETCTTHPAAKWIAEGGRLSENVESKLFNPSEQDAPDQELLLNSSAVIFGNPPVSRICADR